MNTLQELKWALGQSLCDSKSATNETLSAAQYSAGFDILMQHNRGIYGSFIVPQLSQLLETLSRSRSHISVLEVGPGPKSVLGDLPIRIRQRIQRYKAFEPNPFFATALDASLRPNVQAESCLPYLSNTPVIHRTPFDRPNIASGSLDASAEEASYDCVLFCHSMYGMKPERRYIERALRLLKPQPDDGLVVVFHRDGVLYFDGLFCHRTASCPTGLVRIPNTDASLDSFSSFIAGRTSPDRLVRADWRRKCRALGHRDEANPDFLLFGAPEIMVAFTRDATRVPELTMKVPSSNVDRSIKNRVARYHRPAWTVRPTTIEQVQHCVRWAVNHKTSLTVVAGGHSGQCVWPNTVSIDMGAFDQVRILPADEDAQSRQPLIVAGAGCQIGDIVQRSMTEGVIVPLGARPTVGAGLWLQGGIGHLARMYGLACDAIVGAVIVSLATSQIFCLGDVPGQSRPSGAVRPENEAQLLWAIRGAGTNFGIVIDVVFRSSVAPGFSTQDWTVSLCDRLEAQRILKDFQELVADKLDRDCSADMYLYCDVDQMRLGVSMTRASIYAESSPPTPTAVRADWRAEDPKVVNAIGLFDTELYISGMHGGHGGGKTSSFKRCLFLTSIGDRRVTGSLVAAIENRPSPFCYLHLLQGGGAIGDVGADATAFGCREWKFACVITGVWSRDLDNTTTARAAVQWVYEVAESLTPYSSGAYSADLGPDPRDKEMAAMAFGTNLSRLARLKRSLDPNHVLAYTCPLHDQPQRPKLIIIVTGESCAGKDYCAEVWVTVFSEGRRDLRARAVSISDATKRAYAAATGANLDLLLRDRTYKERHRRALTTFFQDQVRKRPQLPQETFLDVVNNAKDVDVLIVTGMRDQSPAATFSPSVPDSRLLEVRIHADVETRLSRRGCYGLHDDGISNTLKGSIKQDLDPEPLDNPPGLTFNNNVCGDAGVRRFSRQHLFPFLSEDHQTLYDMVRQVPSFPLPGINFRHVLGISQQSGGLSLCTSLMRSRFQGDWADIHAIVSCEAGGIVYGSALASRVNAAFVLVRKAGKLPPPTFSIVKSSSYISSSISTPDESRFELEKGVIPEGASVVVVDDVLSTGQTLCAVLSLLYEAGVHAKSITVIVVAEFPVHGARALLLRRGFGRVRVESLLIFGGR